MWSFKRFNRLRSLDHYLTKVMEIEGQISEAEAAKLIELARAVPREEVIVEIGSYRGRSSVALGFGSMLGNSCRVYAVDPHASFVGPCGGVFGACDQAALYDNISKTGLGEIVSVISLPSENSAKAWPDSLRLGLLWIDGDHNYQAVKLDWENWRSHVSRLGTVAFHDSSYKDVQRLVRELVDTRQLIYQGRIDELTWFTRTAS